jgi:hypothetical protein
MSAVSGTKGVRNMRRAERSRTDRLQDVGVFRQLCDCHSQFARRTRDT